MNFSLSAESHPHTPTVRNHKRSYKLVVTCSLTISLIGAAGVVWNQSGALWPFHWKSKTVQSDEIRTVRDGDFIPQISNVKAAITHNNPNLMAIVELIDESAKKAFYYPATVQNGFAYWTLKAGNVQDTNRVYSVRGLLVPEDADIRFEQGYDRPLSGEELFPRMHLHR